MQLFCHSTLQAEHMLTSSEEKECKDNITDILKDKRFIYDYTICAISPVKGRVMNSCHGDSGGPLACALEKGKYFLIGVVSLGSRNCTDIPEDPGQYISVPWFRNWIKEHKGT